MTQFCEMQLHQDEEHAAGAQVGPGFADDDSNAGEEDSKPVLRTTFAFRTAIKNCLRAGASALIAGIFTLIGATNRAFVPPLDPTFASVTAAFTIGSNLGETICYCWQAMIGTLVPSVLIWICVSLFGTHLSALALFGICCFLLIGYLPTSVTFKKYSLGQLVYVVLCAVCMLVEQGLMYCVVIMALCRYYLMVFADPKADVTMTDIWWLYGFGFIGFAGAILPMLLPRPVLASASACKLCFHTADVTVQLLNALVDWFADPTAELRYRYVHTAFKFCSLVPHRDR